MVMRDGDTWLTSRVALPQTAEEPAADMLHFVLPPALPACRAAWRSVEELP
jgi:hypothetical protein